MDSKRGALNPEQVDLIFAHLPLDASFADENDVLVWWRGDTYRTCDEAFIDRDVRDCHPEGSLAALEAILSAFKAGERDTADGWHEDEGRFVLTRYAAVRDANATYKGILEINMDLTELRALSGAQALPGWGDHDE